MLKELFDFLGTELITQHDSALWTEFAELLGKFAESMNEGDDQWTGGLFNSNADVKVMDPFEGLGEILSW